RKEGGKFLLRIEDTDKARSTDENTKVILDGLTWLGLDWDEPPIFQGARLARHQQVADQLLKQGKAYMEEDAIRLRVPPGELSWEDAVHGRISFKGEDIRDFVILRSDRAPLYNFAVVVDDIDMQITHVLRGADHSRTRRQQAFQSARRDGCRMLPTSRYSPRGDAQLSRVAWMESGRRSRDHEQRGAAKPLFARRDSQKAVRIRYDEARVDEWAVPDGKVRRRVAAAGGTRAGKAGSQWQY